MTDETWHCAECGSRNIQHDAIVQWNSTTEEFDVVSVLDGTWCEDCMGRDPTRENEGSPVFGIPPEEEGL